MHQGSETCAGEIGFVALDEADKMLSLGFKPQLDQIWERMLNRVPADSDGFPDGATNRPQVFSHPDSPKDVHHDMTFLEVCHMRVLVHLAFMSRMSFAAKSDRLASKMLVLQEKCCDINIVACTDSARPTQQRQRNFGINRSVEVFHL